LKKNKLSIILSALSDKEVKEFRQFVNSPFFNKNKKLLKLIDFLIKFHPTFNHKKFTEIEAINVLSLNRKNGKAQLAKLSTSLFKLFKTFNYHNRSNEIELDFELLKFYVEKELAHLFNNKQALFEKELDALQQNEEQFWHYYKFNDLIRNHLSFTQDKGIGDINYQKTTDALDQFYVLTKLKFTALKKNRQKVVNYRYTFPFINNILDEINSNEIFDTPLIQIWIGIINIIDAEKPTIIQYNNLKSYFLKHQEIITDDDSREIFVYLKNIANQVFPQGKDYFVEYFDLSKKQYEKGFLYYNGFIPPTEFLNIIRIGIAAAENNYIKEFIKDNKNLISTEYQEKESIYELGMAILLFDEKKYDEVLDILNQIKNVNVYRKMHERRIRLLVYYELDMMSLFDDLINSFRKYLTINKDDLAEFHVNVNRDFINVAAGLYKLIKTDKKKLSAFKEEIDDLRTLPYRSWFEEKLSKLQ